MREQMVLVFGEILQLCDQIAVLERKADSISIRIDYLNEMAKGSVHYAPLIRSSEIELDAVNNECYSILERATALTTVFQHLAWCVLDTFPEDGHDSETIALKESIFGHMSQAVADADTVTKLVTTKS